MLELVRDLTPRALEAIAALEERVIAHDGGRLKLEWTSLRERDDDRCLWWEGDRLLGFVGIYSHGAPTMELAGMVDPAARRRGIATSLLDAAIPRAGTFAKKLLVVPRNAAGGTELARAREARLEHSEHAMVLRGAPTAGREGPPFSLRGATAADTPALERLLDEAFGFSTGEIAARIMRETLVVEQAGAVVGTLRVTREGDAGGIYGFAVDAALRGRGIGRAVLRRVCGQLHDEGFARVGLEVATDNEHALGLYTSVGFERVMTEDYYEL